MDYKTQAEKLIKLRGDTIRHDVTFFEDGNLAEVWEEYSVDELKEIFFSEEEDPEDKIIEKELSIEDYECGYRDAPIKHCECCCCMYCLELSW